MSTQDASSPRTTRIIVDDDPIVREVLTTALGSETDIEVIATAANGAEAVDVVHARTVDVVLMDVQMPCWTGWPPPRASSPWAGAPGSCC